MKSAYLTKLSIITLHNFKIMSYWNTFNFTTVYFYSNILRKLYNATTALQNIFSGGNWCQNRNFSILILKEEINKTLFYISGHKCLILK